METAGEGGAWGMALLASYLMHKAEDEQLETYLAEKAFTGSQGSIILPDPTDVAGFEAFMERYKNGLPIEQMAVKAFG
jgi:hypothetical protein